MILLEDAFNQQRVANATFWTEYAGELVQTPITRPAGHHAYHQYSICVADKCHQWVNYLCEKGIANLISHSIITRKKLFASNILLNIDLQAKWSRQRISKWRISLFHDLLVWTLQSPHRLSLLPQLTLIFHELCYTKQRETVVNNRPGQKYCRLCVRRSASRGILLKISLRKITGY